MYPNDKFPIFWDLVVTVILLASCLMTPINLAFPHLADDTNWTTACLIIDFLFLMDIFINFFSAYEDQDLRIQDDRKLIVKNYLRGWFIIDIVAILPIETLLDITQGNASTH
jgi:hypothetical protein